MPRVNTSTSIRSMGRAAPCQNGLIRGPFVFFFFLLEDEDDEEEKESQTKSVPRVKEECVLSSCASKNFKKKRTDRRFRRQTDRRKQKLSLVWTLFLGGGGSLVNPKNAK